MSVDAAAEDRLPWLADEPAPQPVKRRRGAPLVWAAALLLAMGGGLWTYKTGIEDRAATPVPPAHFSTTVHLPPPTVPQPVEVRIPPQPVVRPAPVPQVRPSPVRQVHIPGPAAERGTPRSTKTLAPTKKTVPQVAPPTAAPAKSTAQPALEPGLAKPWNPRLVRGAAGRLVQVGAFGSVHQAKRGWWFMVHDYPAMAHLPAVVRETRNSKGRAFFRFDVGTTSQAHSEVLCQRMTKVGLSCAVIGLPWKAKVER